MGSTLQKPNIGPEVQNHPKSLQIQPGFWVKIGSPFVHMTKFHRFSGSFFGAHLSSIAIWTHLVMVSNKLDNMLPIYAQISFPKMQFGLFWVVMAPFGLETGPNGSRNLMDHLWTSFGQVLVQFRVSSVLSGLWALFFAFGWKDGGICPCRCLAHRISLQLSRISWQPSKK